MDLYHYFLLFIMYAFIGWLIEVLGHSFLHKKIIDRGFLIGPYLPIYGLGGIMITFFLTKYYHSPMTLFVMAMVICAVLEYFTSYIMEKLFKARWWDYSNMRYNINGRICLETMIPFGLLGCFCIYCVNPFLTSWLDMMSPMVMHIVTSFLVIIFTLDVIFSLKIIANVRQSITKFVSKDNTEEITKKVKESLKSKSRLNNRLVNAFPKMKLSLNKEIKRIKQNVKSLLVK